jgi:hypothetical protein
MTTLRWEKEERAAKRWRKLAMATVVAGSCIGIAATGRLVVDVFAWQSSSARARQVGREMRPDHEVINAITAMQLDAIESVSVLREIAARGGPSGLAAEVALSRIAQNAAR